MHFLKIIEKLKICFHDDWTNMRTEGLSFNFRLYSTGLTRITKQKQNSRMLWFSKREKMKIFNLSVQDMNNRVKATVCPSLFTNFSSNVNISRNQFLFSLCALSQCSCQVFYSLATDADCIYEFKLWNWELGRLQKRWWKKLFIS